LLKYKNRTFTTKELLICFFSVELIFFLVFFGVGGLVYKNPCEENEHLNQGVRDRGDREKKVTGYKKLSVLFPNIIYDFYL
jgi:hypothetical protein